MSDTVTFVVNGEHRSLDVEGRTLLVHALRDGLGLTGAHIGCDTSQCGACTVLLDGRAVKSCTVLAQQADDREITTIEGLASNGAMHPLQSAFVEHHGLQCGFCTPGVILTAADLLSRNPAPSEQEIRHALRGNLCRCTGYQGIVQSVRAAAAEARMIPAATRYARASDVAHALELLGEPDAKAIAGGQSLIPVMKLRIARPSLVVDISRLGLRGVDERGGELHIGALTTWDELIRADALDRPGLAAIAECARGIGDVQVRNLGTIGGSVAHADPASDMPAVLLALGARLHLRSPAGEREVALGDLLVGPFLTALGPQELITNIVVPVPVKGSGSAYASVEHPASGFALVGAAALAAPIGETVALTGVGATPFVVLGGDLRAAIAAGDFFGDRFASEEYRRELAVVVAERALAAARERARGDA